MQLCGGYFIQLYRRQKVLGDDSALNFARSAGVSSYHTYVFGMLSVIHTRTGILNFARDVLRSA